MGARGRKSSAELQVASVSSIDRPRPPAWLTDEQSEEWRQVVNVMPADQLDRARWPLLESYCQHAVMLRHIRELISDLEARDDLDIAEYDRLGKMQERESRMLSSLAIRLNIAQSSSYERQKRKGGKKPPWQVEG